MKAKTLFSILLLIVWPPHLLSARDKGTKPPAPAGWAYVHRDPVEVRPGPSNTKRNLAHLGRGALVPVFEVRAKGNSSWARVRVVDLGTLTPRMGWVDSSQIEPLAADQFPLDADLLKQLGGEYLEDAVASQIALARFLLRQGRQDPALICFLGSPFVSHARLQIFRRSQAKFVPGAYLDLAFSEMQAGITSIEIRDLIGDGNECLVTREPFNLGPENRGVNLVIRRIEGDALKILWEGPVEFRNLASFPPRPQALQPLERNIGAAGTVTKATVDFRPRGSLSEPVWKGKVEFHAFNREEPLETITIEKVCPWDGAKFAPLR